MTPTTFIRHIRPEGVRSDLQKGDQTTKVSDVAFSWGFNHLGRFASYYERKYGEKPSRTLRAALVEPRPVAPPAWQPKVAREERSMTKTKPGRARPSGARGCTKASISHWCRDILMRVASRLVSRWKN
ncbi:helix-turn-helix domain-containing protein [Williamsia soli]|uniref:helix-turn-helix domain-containing protein n=1 Tax=Williamsia soli TaxID=364929 RepID=UPI001F01C496|nr:helix-turn-helix domain-containing protein [Williamsia soli]